MDDVRAYEQAECEIKRVLREQAAERCEFRRSAALSIDYLLGEVPGVGHVFC